MNELIEKARNGDKDAFLEVYSSNRKNLYKYCRNLCGNDADAQDLMQQTYLRAWLKIPGMKSENISSWLRSVARSIFLNNLKKSNEYFIEEYPEIPDNSQNPEFITEKRDMCRILLKALKDCLSPVQRMTIILYYYDEKSVSEIANIMQVSENTVKSRLFNARKKLREELKKFGNIFTCLSLGFAVMKHKLKNIQIPVNVRITASAVLTAASMALISVSYSPPENKFPDTVITINETGTSENQTTTENKTDIQTSSEMASIERISHATANNVYYTMPTEERQKTAFKSEYEDFEESEEGDREEELTEEKESLTENEEVTTMKKEIITIATAATMAVSGITATTAYSESLATTATVAENTEISETKTYDIWYNYDLIREIVSNKALALSEEYAATLDRTKYTDKEIEMMRMDYYNAEYEKMVEQKISEQMEEIIAEVGIDRENAETSPYVPVIICELTEEQVELAETLDNTEIWEHESWYTFERNKGGEEEIIGCNKINYSFETKFTGIYAGETAEIRTQGRAWGYVAGDPVIEISVEDENIAKITKIDGKSIYVEGVAPGRTHIKVKFPKDEEHPSSFLDGYTFYQKNEFSYPIEVWGDLRFSAENVISLDTDPNTTYGFFLHGYDFGNKFYETGESPVKYTVDNENIAKIVAFQRDMVSLKGISAGETVLRAETPEGQTAEARVIVSEYVMPTTVAIETTPANTVTTTVDLCGGDIYTSYIIGDANSDFKVSISDSVKILQNLSNKEKYPLTEQETTNADCYDPGSGVTGMDAQAVQKLDAGIIDKLPEVIS